MLLFCNLFAGEPVRRYCLFVAVNIPSYEPVRGTRLVLYMSGIASCRRPLGFCSWCLGSSVVFYDAFESFGLFLGRILEESRKHLEALESLGS